MWVNKIGLVISLVRRAASKTAVKGALLAHHSRVLVSHSESDIASHVKF